MVYDPITTFAIYAIGFLLVLTIVAAIADLWGAHVERKLRDQARADARAKLREERETSSVEWL